MGKIDAAKILSLPHPPWTPRFHTLSGGARAAILPLYWALVIFTTPIGPAIAIAKETGDAAKWGKTVGTTARAALDYWSNQTGEDISGAVRMPSSPVALEIAHSARSWYDNQGAEGGDRLAIYAAGVEAWIELGEHRGRRLVVKRVGMGTLTRMADRTFKRPV